MFWTNPGNREHCQKTKPLVDGRISEFGFFKLGVHHLHEHDGKVVLERAQRYIDEQFNIDEAAGAAVVEHIDALEVDFIGYFLFALDADAVFGVILHKAVVNEGVGTAGGDLDADPLKGRRIRSVVSSVNW